MKKYLETKLMALSREEFAAGPMEVPGEADDDRRGSFLESESFDVPTLPPASEQVVERTVTDGVDDDPSNAPKPSNEYVLVSTNPRRFSFTQALPC